MYIHTCSIIILYMYIHVYVYVCVYIYIYIYIYMRRRRLAPPQMSFALHEQLWEAATLMIYYTMLYYNIILYYIIVCLTEAAMLSALRRRG